MRRPWLRGEIGVGAEDAELGEGRRLGGEEGDLDAVPLACGGGGGRVKKTAGNRTGYRGYRCNRSGPVPVPGGSNRGKIQILNLNSRK